MFFNSRKHHCANLQFRTIWAKPAIICHLVFSSFTSQVQAQITFGEQASLTGDISIFYQYYHLKADATAPIGSRFPANLFRFDFNGKLSLSKDFYVPVTIRLGNTAPSPLTPVAKSQSFTQYLLHPANIIYFGPTWKNLQLHLGSYVPVYSVLSTGDLQIFGVGATYRYHDYRFFANYGISQRAIESTAYREHFTSFRIERKFHSKMTAGLNFVETKDNVNSIKTAPLTQLPQQGVIITLDGKYRMNNQLSFSAEIGNGAFVSDLTDATKHHEFSPAALFISGKRSYVSGYAFAAGVQYAKRNFGINGSLKKIGKDYHQVAYPQNVSDVIDVKVSPYGNVWKHKIRINGQLGFSSNNFSSIDTGLFGKQIFEMINSVATPWKFFEAQLYFFHANISSGAPGNSTKYKATTQNFSIAPAFKKEWMHVKHKLLYRFQMDVSNTKSNPAGFTVKVTNFFNQISYSGTYKEYTGTISYRLFTNKFPAFKTNVNTISVDGKADLLNNTLHAFVTIVFERTKSPSVSGALGKRSYVKLGADYSVNKKIKVGLIVSNNHFRYGKDTTFPKMDEQIAQVRMSYKI